MARRKTNGTVRSSQERTAAQIRTERAEKKKKIADAKAKLLGFNLSIREGVEDINFLIENKVSQGRISSAQASLAGLREQAQAQADILKALRAE